MFRGSSPFSPTDLDMWDAKSHFSAQTSAWCGTTSLSGSGFLSKVSPSAGGFMQNDPGLRKWQSLSHLEPECPTLSSGAELRAARGGSSFRQTETVHWLQEAHERLESQLDQLKTRDMRLSYNVSAPQLLSMKHKQLSGVMKSPEQQIEATELSEIEKSKQRRELSEKVLKLEKDLSQMRSALDGGTIDEPTEGARGSLNIALPQEDQKVDTELLKLKEALKEAEGKARTLEEGRDKALQHLQTSTETQRTLLSQIEELNKKLSHAAQDHSELQTQLTEANNKISQACLEKAILLTQVLKLEDNIKEMKAQLTETLSDKDHLIREKAELLQRVQVLEVQLEKTQHSSVSRELLDHLANADSHNNKQDQEDVVMKEDSKALREVGLRGELEMIKPKQEISQHVLQELTDKKILNTNQIADLETRCSQLIREKEELQSKTECRLKEMQETCCQHRESVEVLKLENQKLQDQRLHLEAELLEKEKMLQMREEECRNQDIVRVQTVEELKAVASHWTEKWQKVALALQSTQEELEELKENSRNKGGCDLLLRDELAKLELERSRNQALLHRDKDKGKGETVQTQDKGTETCLSESSLLWEPPSDLQSRQNKSFQVGIQSGEVQRLKQKLAERETELSEKEHALKSLERLRDMERNEAKIKISALELKLMKKVPEDGQDEGTDVSTPDSEESPGKVNQMLPGQRLQTLRQFYMAEDGKPSVEGRRGKTACPLNLDTEQQRRMVTEQLKSLFKEREAKEAQKANSTGASSPQEWTPTVKPVRAAADRRNWQRASGLMPVFEEDEEINDCPAEEEGEAEEETHDEESLLHQRQPEMSAMTAEITNLKAKNGNQLQGLRLKRSIEDLSPAEERSDKSSQCSDECSPHWTLPLYPDGVFLAELVEICSPDEEEGEVK